MEATEDFCAIIELLDNAGKRIDISEPEACVNITDYDRRLDGILKRYAHCLPNRATDWFSRNRSYLQ